MYVRLFFFSSPTLSFRLDTKVNYCLSETTNLVPMMSAFNSTLNNLPELVVEEIILNAIEKSPLDLKNLLVCSIQFKELIQRKVIQCPTRKWSKTIQRMEQKLAGDWSLGVYPTSNELKAYLFLNDEKILSDFLFSDLSSRIKSKLSISGTLGVDGIIADLSTCDGEEFVDLVNAACILVEQRSLKFPEVWIYSMDLTAVDVESLQVILSNTERLVKISNIRGIQLEDIFPSVGSQVLGLRSLALNQRETKALVEAMEKNISAVIFCSELGEHLSLDISELLKYSGLEDSKCELITLWSEFRDCYGEEMRKWAQDKEWIVVYDSPEDGLELQKSL